jgi:chromosome partitioning protein
MKGGVGKSTLAVNIADVLARRHGKRVLLIDVDPQFNATQMLLSGDDYVAKIDAGHNTILDVFDDQPKIRMSAVAGAQVVPAVALEAIAPWKISLPTAVLGGSLHLLAGDLQLNRLEMNAASGRERRLKRFVEICEKRDDFDFVIIDTPPTPSSWMRRASR